VVNPGFRDWSPITVAGATLVGGNQTGGGGIFAIEVASGKVKWSHRPVFSSGTASVSTPPAIAGDLVITPFAAANPGAVTAVLLTTGKEVWRGPDPERHAGVAVEAGVAYILGKDGNFYALDASTGREQWKVKFATNLAACASQPIVRDGTVYLTGIGAATPGDVAKPAGYYLFALDAKNGQERWRYRAEAEDVYQGVCLRQPVVTADAIYATGDTSIYAVDRATGRDRWKPIVVRMPVEGRPRNVEVFGLVDAGAVVVGMTSTALVAFNKASGKTEWELPGEYNTNSPSMARASDVLYFQGSPAAKPAPVSRGTLYALDLGTRAILWSFTRPTKEPNWPFGNVTPVDGGVWVDSYQALVKLQ
jgi:outer membrane protein assembly factor BamB